MKGMKRKKQLVLSIVSSLVLGIGSLFYWDYKKDKNRQEEDLLAQRVREFFEEKFVDLSAFYVTDYDIKQDKLMGGFVLVDGTCYQFTYQNDQIDYKEDIHVNSKNV